MRSLLYVVLLFVITACSYSGSQPKVLDEAQSMMHSDPSAALSKLNSMDVSEFQDSATMARWALLYSEAMAENSISAPTDTIVNMAIDYYRQHHMHAEFAKASQLKGMIQSSGDADALATALYLQKEKEFFLYKERAERRIYMLLALVILSVAAVIIVWMSQRLKVQTLRSEALMAEASGFRSQIEASRSDVDRLEMKLHGLLDSRFTLIDSLCQTYYESQGTKSERKAIVDQVKKQIESVRTDSFAEMEHAVNDCRDNLLERIMECTPGIKREEYMLLVYIASGLSSRTISLLLGESIDVIYKRKSRLKFRLKESCASVCPEVMDIF